MKLMTPNEERRWRAEARRAYGRDGCSERSRELMAEAREVRRNHIQMVADCEQELGDQGPLISGGLREHWPPHIKNLVRGLAQRLSDLIDLSYQYHCAAGRRPETWRVAWHGRPPEGWWKQT